MEEVVGCALIEPLVVEVVVADGEGGLIGAVLVVAEGDGGAGAARRLLLGVC